MLCLHGKPAVTSTTENGTFWSCGEPSKCFVCSGEEKHLYDKAIKTFLATKQDRPRCCGIVPASDAERHYAKFRVYTGTEQHKWWTAYKEDIGRPFFVCGKNDERNPRGCGYFAWGDKNIVPIPLCDHGEQCMLRDKTQSPRPYYICKKKIGGCSYFEWGDLPNEDPLQIKRRLERLSHLSKEDRRNPWISASCFNGQMDSKKV